MALACEELGQDAVTAQQLHQRYRSLAAGTALTAPRRGGGGALASGMRCKAGGRGCAQRPDSMVLCMLGTQEAVHLWRNSSLVCAKLMTKAKQADFETSERHTATFNLACLLGLDPDGNCAPATPVNYGSSRNQNCSTEHHQRTVACDSCNHVSLALQEALLLHMYKLPCPPFLRGAFLPLAAVRGELWGGAVAASMQAFISEDPLSSCR